MKVNEDAEVQMLRAQVERLKRKVATALAALRRGSALTLREREDAIEEIER